jgi:hypothetical protein
MALYGPRSRSSRRVRGLGPRTFSAQGGIFALTGASLMFALVGCGASSPEQRSSSPQAAAIRSYLATYFTFQSWYPAVDQVQTAGNTAEISATLPGNTTGRQSALQICEAVLRSHRISKVTVRYSSTSVSCP